MGDPTKPAEPKSPHHAAFLEWWDIHRRGSNRVELGKLDTMAGLMGYAVKAWCELSYYAGRDEAK